MTFNRVLSLDLSRALGGGKVVVFPAFGANYALNGRVRLTIDRSETDEAGTARLAARWEILDASQAARCTLPHLISGNRARPATPPR